MKLSKHEREKVVTCCKDVMITDYDFNSDEEYPINWFKKQFDFIDDKKIKEHLGDEFYQARFCYSLMKTLQLPMSKNKGLIKFQIIQYASICEALLNYIIENRFKTEFENKYAKNTYADCTNAMSSKTKITYDGNPVYLCKNKRQKAKIEWTSAAIKADFATDKGIINRQTRDAFCSLYDLRNNAHILKAVRSNYYPKPKEAADAYKLAFDFITEIRSFCTSTLVL